MEVQEEPPEENPCSGTYDGRTSTETNERQTLNKNSVRARKADNEKKELQDENAKEYNNDG